MKLFYCDTLQPRKVCAAARYLKAPVEFVFVDLGKGEHVMPGFVTLNPNRKVPVLVHGEKVLWESDAILCELAREAGPELWPKGEDGAIELVKWFSWNAHHFNRAGGSLYFEYVIRPRFNLGPPDAPMVEESLKDFRKFARVLDDHLAGRKWLMGDQLTIADFSVGVPLPYAEASRMPVGEFPNLARWHDRLSELDGWLDPWPARD